MPTPFRLVPWSLPFLDHVCSETLRLTHDQPGRAVVIFPHNRPKRYFMPLFKHTGKACILPRLYTISELMNAWCAHVNEASAKKGTPPREAGALDQVALLHLCVGQLRDNDPQFRERLGELGELDEARFFPWGMRLAQLLESCLGEGLSPADMEHAEGDVAPFAATLLSALGRLFRLYQHMLQAHELTTPGLDAFMVTESLPGHAVPAFVDPAQHPVIIAGFNALNGAEDQLFRHLWLAGAHIFLHGHPDLATLATKKAEAQKPPAGCAMLADWLRAWDATCEITAPPSAHETQISFFAGHDLHSQIAALREDLDTLPGLFETVAPDNASASGDFGDLKNVDGSGTHENDATPTVAVALTHANALLPVLHHLPAHNCNVSLGYPLDRSLLSRLIHDVLAVREAHAATPEMPVLMPIQVPAPEPAHVKVHWRAWATLLRHPTLRLMKPDNASWRQALRALESLARSGARYISPHEHVQQVKAEAAPEIIPLLNDLLTHTVDSWAAASTPAHMAAALGGLCELLLARGELWPRFPLDAECLFRLMQHMVPALRNNLMAHKDLPWPLLATMLKGLFAAERVPFEADPLTGLQVLGMLETRLLHFEHVYVLDMAEEHLPGPPDRNPLLPDNLRRALGLSGTREREGLAAYTFHRLLASARHVHLYWPENEAGVQRSRLAEARVWIEEQRSGRLIGPGEAPLRAPQNTVTLPESRMRTVPRTPAIQQRMDELLARPISPTLLDAYLTCPLRFYYERLCRIRPMDEVNEGDDAPGVGTLVHETLRQFMTPWIGRVFRPGKDAEKQLTAIFLQQLADSDLLRRLPPESAAMLRVAGPERLRRFLQNQPNEPFIRLLETELRADIPIAGHTMTLYGILDRVDDRVDDRGVEHGGDGGGGGGGGDAQNQNASSENNASSNLRHIHILDYKTGSIRLPAPSFWKNDSFFEELHTALSSDHTTDQGLNPEIDPENKLFLQLADGVKSLQLPFYLYLYRQAQNHPAHNAAGVRLAEEGKEISLFAPDIPADLHKNALENNIPALLHYTLRHMLQSPEFFPRQGRHCDWCFSNKLCKV